MPTVPAITDVAPPRVTRRITALLLSTKTASPLTGSTAPKEVLENSAAAPAPPEKPWEPVRLPATTEMVHPLGVAVPLAVTDAVAVGEAVPVPVAVTEAPSEAEGVGVGVNEGDGQNSRRNVVASEMYTKLPPALLATLPRKTVENVSCPTPRGPSAEPGTPTPAMVVTARVESTTRRTRLLPASTTSKFPRLSSATEQGKLNLALVPVPSAKPALPPANVLTSPPPSKRTRWFIASAI